MRTIPVILAAAAGLALGIGATWWTMHRSMPTPSAAAPASTATNKQVLYWYDPMVPNQHFDHPGKSPFMDMQLVPKYAGGGSDNAGVVSIDPRQVQNLGVRTARATYGKLASSVRATGTVAFDEREVSVVQARVGGIVEQLLVRAPLTSVKQGQPLLTLLAPDWTAAQEEYLSLRRAQSQGLDPMRAAARRRLLLLGMDEGQVRAIERSGQAQTRITIAAPRDGVLGELSVREGTTVMAGTPLLRLNGLDTVWINAAIPQAQIARVRAGASASATSPAFPGERFEGEIEALLPEIDAATRTQTARLVLHNPQHRLAPGMFAQIEVAGGDAPARVLVPSEAVIATGSRSVLIVAEGEGRFRAQEVRLGDEAAGHTEILEGVNEGNSVVLSGQFLIDSEASLSGTLARLEATSSPASAADHRTLSAATAEQHHAEGALKAIDGTQWTVATEAIASMEMPAMTMTFLVPASVPAPKVKSGQRLRFTFVRNGEGDFEINRFLPAAGEAP